MGNSFFITEENLIGSIANAIIQIKKIKNGKITTTDTSSLIRLIEFLENANGENYHKLLYDKYFIVSEDVLKNLHSEFRQKNVSHNIDFDDLKKTLLNISTDIVSLDKLTAKLREIAVVLLQIKNQKQIEM